MREAGRWSVIGGGISELRAPRKLLNSYETHRSTSLFELHPRFLTAVTEGMEISDDHVDLAFRTMPVIRTQAVMHGGEITKEVTSEVVGRA